MAFTADNLVDAIERASFLPTSVSTFTSAELLLLADQKIRTVIIPTIWSALEERYVFVEDQTVTAEQSDYPIPARFLNSAIREAKLIIGSAVKDLPVIAIEDITSTQTGEPTHCYLRGDNLVLYPTPASTTGTLRLFGHLAPGSLVLVADAAVITSKTSTTVTVTSIPSSWVTGDIFDFVAKNGSHSYRAVDKTSTLISGTTITFSAVPSNVQVGDYVTLADTSPLVQLPNSLREPLAQLVAAEILKSMSAPGADEAMASAEKSLKIVTGMLSPRIVGGPPTVRPSHSWR